MKYIILQLILNAVTGEPVAPPTQYAPPNAVAESYDSYEACDEAKSNIGPQSAKDGRVLVFACATEKQITQL